MKCHIDECAYHEDCMILEITKKPQPKNSDSCSYFKTFATLEKLKRKHAPPVKPKKS